jgi:hypothetical protein
VVSEYKEFNCLFRHQQYHFPAFVACQAVHRQLEKLGSSMNSGATLWSTSASHSVLFKPIDPVDYMAGSIQDGLKTLGHAEAHWGSHHGTAAAREPTTSKHSLGLV